MLALLFGIASSAGWIIFDVVVSVVTYPLMPQKQWWAFVVSGAVLVVLTIVSEILTYLDRRNDETRHSGEHIAIATGTLAIFERLRNLTQTTGQPVDRTIEIATEQIQSLQTEVADLSTMFWRSPNEVEAKKLQQALEEIGIHSVRFHTHENTDCSRLARHLMAIFQLADWKVSGLHTGTYSNLTASGIHVLGKDTLELASQVADVIRLSINATCSALVLLGPEET